MTEKQRRCCAQLQSQLTAAKNNLRNLAQRAAYADQRGRDISKFRRLIEEQKGEIARYEQSIVDHEADHALDGLPLDERIRNGV